ncbi:MAG TPA: M48 family metalloprotease [Terriglobia bacterium]|nr:M48 family metalloprotease [Terriglobia bacterium]
MTASALPILEPPNLGRSYTKRMRWAAEIRILYWIAAFLAYGFLGIHTRVAEAAQKVARSLYVQIAFCWLPLWFILAMGSFLVSLYCFWLDRKFGLSKSNLPLWLMDFLKGIAFTYFLGAAILEIAYASHALLPSYAWILEGLLTTLGFFGITRSASWILSLFYSVVPLANGPLQERLSRLATKAGIPVGMICEWRISKRTRKANALVAGFGTARRILLTDTLISALDEDEVEALVSHEFGHCAFHHIIKRVLLQGAIFCLIFLTIDGAVGTGMLPFAPDITSWNDSRLLPGFFLVWGFGWTYGTIIMGALARRQEKAADLYSWKLLGRVRPFITAMRKITALNLIEFDRSSQWKYSHPSTAIRIEEAVLYAKSQGEALEEI